MESRYDESNKITILSIIWNIVDTLVALLAIINIYSIYKLFKYVLKEYHNN